MYDGKDAFGNIWPEPYTRSPEETRFTQNFKLEYVAEGPIHLMKYRGGYGGFVRVDDEWHLCFWSVDGKCNNPNFHFNTVTIRKHDPGPTVYQAAEERLRKIKNEINDLLDEKSMLEVRLRTQKYANMLESERIASE